MSGHITETILREEIDFKREEIESLRATLKEKDEALQELRDKLAEAEKDTKYLEWMVFNSASVHHANDGEVCLVIWFDENGDRNVTRTHGTSREAIAAAIAKEGSNGRV